MDKLVVEPFDEHEDEAEFEETPFERFTAEIGRAIRNFFGQRDHPKISNLVGTDRYIGNEKASGDVSGSGGDDLSS